MSVKRVCDAQLACLACNRYLFTWHGVTPLDPSVRESARKREQEHESVCAKKTGPRLFSIVWKNRRDVESYER